MRAADLQPGDRYDHPNPETAFEVLTRDDAPDGFVTVTARFGTGLTDTVTWPDDYQLPTVLACPRHQHPGAFDTLEDFVQHLAQDLAQMEQTMTEFATNQAHLGADVAALRQAVSDAVAELKAAAANGQSLDFSKLDALVTDTQAEATADAPPAPAAHRRPPRRFRRWTSPASRSTPTSMTATRSTPAPGRPRPCTARTARPSTRSAATRTVCPPVAARRGCRTRAPLANLSRATHS